MAYNYQLLPEAKDDLDGAVAWYTEKGTPTAQRFIDAYLKVVRRLTDNPFLFPKARGDMRKARLAKPFPTMPTSLFRAMWFSSWRFFTTAASGGVAGEGMRDVNATKISVEVTIRALCRQGNRIPSARNRC